MEIFQSYCYVAWSTPLLHEDYLVEFALQQSKTDVNQWILINSTFFVHILQSKSETADALRYLTNPVLHVFHHSEYLTEFVEP